MRIQHLRTGVLCLAVGLAAVAGAYCYATVAGEPVEVQAAPQTWLLGKQQSASVTVHAATPYTAGATAWLTIAGTVIEATSVFADDRGEVVAKFPEAACKSLVAPPEATLVFGCETDWGVFTGDDTVAVRTWRSGR